MKLFWQCLFSPRLYKIYHNGPRNNTYQSNNMEKISSRILTLANTLYSVCLYTSPFIAMYIYKRGFFSMNELYALAKVFTGIGSILAVSFILRGYGRTQNPRYVEFLQALSAPRTNIIAYLEGIRKYDFEFMAWPATFGVSNRVRYPWFHVNPFKTCANNNLPRSQRMAIQALAYFAVHAFGVKITYPGTIKVISNMFWEPILQGRAQLVENHNGKRAKILTAEGNEIDTMFVDNRENSAKGRTLVICCEGNSGFYEIGIMESPIKTGFSVLGWNHPGFACSTGTPFPNQEHNAVDAVVQYAMHMLGFKPNKIVMYGWSIGGYTAAWAAVRHQLNGLILDATFDDLLPLGENQMPKSWSLLVREVVRSYLDLNIADLVTQYDGPVQLIRRTQDEIICLKPGRLETNCGNNLLIKLICHRHAGLVEDGANPQSTLQRYINILESQRAALEMEDIDESDRTVLGLIAHYSQDFKSNHCTPLMPEYFEEVMEKIVKKYN